VAAVYKTHLVLNSEIDSSNLAHVRNNEINSDSDPARTQLPAQEQRTSLAEENVVGFTTSVERNGFTPNFIYVPVLPQQTRSEIILAT
jgi:hypothetical protein